MEIIILVPLAIVAGLIINEARRRMRDTKE